MKVDELRTALGKYDTIVLKEIAVELYKMIPKLRKEDSGLDELLLDFIKEKSNPAKKDIPVNFETLKAEIEQFLVYADMQYYLAPNKYVRKEQRSKWRFEVKRFIKELIKIGGENSEEAGSLLVNVYSMLSYGCHYCIFSTENPFSSVGYEQVELLSLVLKKIFYSGFSLNAIKSAVFLTLDSNVNWNTLHRNLMSVLVDILKTIDTKEMALLQCIAYRNEYDSYNSAKNIFKESDRSGYRRKEHRNHAVELYLLLKFSLYEYDDGIDYFWKNYVELRDQEITLYCLLTYFLSGDDKRMNSLWIREYEKAVANGIKPRESLKNEYTQRVKESRE